MRKELEILTLDGYLTETSAPGRYGVTFTRTFAATDLLPEIIVCLGYIHSDNNVVNSFIVDVVPEIGKSKSVMLNTFLNEVAEQYLQLSDKFPDTWQEMLLLELGHVRKPVTATNLLKGNVTLFASIPRTERQHLLESYGLHKIAAIVSHGYTEGVESILLTLDSMNEQFGDVANYSSLLTCLKMGIPVEELETAIQLPPEMIAEIYSDYS